MENLNHFLHIQMIIEKLNAFIRIFQSFQSQLHVIFQLQFIPTHAELFIWMCSQDSEEQLTAVTSDSEQHAIISLCAIVLYREAEW